MARSAYTTVRHLRKRRGRGLHAQGRNYYICECGYPLFDGKGITDNQAKELRWGLGLKMCPKCAKAILYETRG